MRLGKVQRHLTPTALFSLLPQQSDTWLALKGARADDLRWHAMLHRDSTQRCYCNCWSSSGTANSAQNMSFHTLCSHLYLYDYEYYNAHIDPTRRWDKSTCSRLSSWFSTNCSNMWREHELSANAESALKSFTNDSESSWWTHPHSLQCWTHLPFSHFQPHCLIHHWWKACRCSLP